MEKCVEMLIKYLIVKREPLRARFRLTLKWSKLVDSSVSVPLNQQQKMRLFNNIFNTYIESATILANTTTAATAAAKTKLLDLLMDLAELYPMCEVAQIQLSQFDAYLQLMIKCHRQLSIEPSSSDESTTPSNRTDDIHTTLDYCNKMRIQRDMDKNAKKSTANKMNRMNIEATTTTTATGCEKKATEQ